MEGGQKGLYFSNSINRVDLDFYFILILQMLQSMEQLILNWQARRHLNWNGGGHG